MDEANKRIQKWITKGNVKRVLDLAGLDLSELPLLPDTVECLDCSINPLLHLHGLPSSLKKLYCNHTKITSFDGLPYGLKVLYFSCNQKLTRVENLPDTITFMNAEDCGFITHVYFPKELRFVYFCDLDKLEYIHYFPEHLKTIMILDTQLESIPPFPPQLEYVSIIQSFLKTIPLLPESVRVAKFLSNHLEEEPYIPSGVKEVCFNCNPFFRRKERLNKKVI